MFRLWGFRAFGGLVVWGLEGFFGVLEVALRPKAWKAQGPAPSGHLLEGSWYLLTNYNCTYNPTYNWDNPYKSL